VADRNKPAPMTSVIATPGVPVPSLSSTAQRWHKPMFIVFLVAWALNAGMTAFGIEAPLGFGWSEALLPLTGAITTLLALAGRLPLQNVFMAGIWIVSLATGILAIGAVTATPFGPFVYTDALGEKLVGTVPWPLPLLWLVLVINARGVARLIMRPWRKTNYYGFWVIGLGCALVVLFALGFEPFASRVKTYWYWESATTVPGWYSAPWVCLLGWFLSALAILSLSIPWLINKHPVKQPMDYQPLIVWVLINLWPAIGNATHQLWWPVLIAAGGNALAITWAVRGARW